MLADALHKDTMFKVTLTVGERGREGGREEGGRGKGVLVCMD